MMQTDIEDDEVVKEFDVYLTHDEDNKYHIFQYPLRPNWREVNFNLLSDMRIKPNQLKVEMDFELDTNTLHYNPDKEERPNKNTLTSSSVQRRTNYAVGVFRGDSMYLVPLHSILQFRPSFEFLSIAEDARKKAQQEDKQAEEGEAEAEGDDDGDKKSTPIGMQFRRKENPRFARPPMRRLEDEPWSPLKFVHEDTRDESKREEVINILSSTPNTQIDMAANSKKYLDELCPPTVPHVGTPAEPNQVSLEVLHKMPAENQVRLIMLIGNIVKFRKVRELATAVPNTTELLSYMERYATMVQGAWVVKSEECCNGPIAAARDYMLYKFHKKGSVNRKKLAEKTGLSDSVAREMLAKVGQVQIPPLRNWQLRHGRDEEFFMEYPELEDKYIKYWESNTKKIKTNVVAYKAGQLTVTKQANPFAPTRTMASTAPSSSSNTNSNTNTTAPTSNKDMIASLNVPLSAGSSSSSAGSKFKGDMELFNEARKSLQESFRMYGVCNMIHLRTRFTTALKIGDPNVKQPAWASDVAMIDEAIRANLDEIAQKISTVYALKSLGDEQQDKFRRVIMEVFNQKPSAKRSDILDKSKTVLGEEFPLSLFTKIIKEFAYTTKGFWILKNGDG